MSQQHTEYFRAVLPDPHTILHLELKAFCAGHIVLLHRLQSPFVTGGTVSEDQLFTAVFLCAQTFEGGAASLNAGNVTRDFVRGWKRKVRGANLKEAKEHFERYIEEGSQFPFVYAPKQKSAEVPITSLPAVHTVRCALKHFYHLGDGEFWNMPWGLAQWDYFTIPVLEGTGDLVRRDYMADAARLADEIHLTWDEQMKGRKPCRN